MGYELYCGLKKGTLNLLSTVVISFMLENATPEEIAEYIAEDTWKSGLAELKRIGTTYYRLPDGTPVHDEKSLKKFRDYIYDLWIKEARKKLDECYRENKWGETVTMINPFTREIKIEYPSSMLGISMLGGILLFMYMIAKRKT